MRLRLPLLILALSVTVFVGFSMCNMGTIPERLATHFDGGGLPNGWMTRTQHLIFMTLFGFGVPALVIGVCYSIRFFPSSLLNVPNASYWRSQEHYPEACQMLFAHSLWFAALLLIWSTLLNHQIMEANRVFPPHLETASVWMLIGFFVVGIALWSISLMLRFAKIPKGA